MTDGFHSQSASYAENVYTPWRHNGHKWASYVSEHIWCLFINWSLINMSNNWFLACHPHHFPTRSSIDPFQHFPVQWNVDCSPLGNYANPRIWCCHYLPPGSLITLGASESLSYSHFSFDLIWIFCVRDIPYRLIWMEFINMFSVYAQTGTHSRLNWWIIVVLT